VRGNPLPPVRKSLGQHFLSDRRILARIADALHLHPTETVVEIGAGRGSLTDLLRDRAGKTIAIEYDRQLAERLRDRYGGDPRVQIVEGDVLQMDLGALAPRGFALVGNVPYYITTPILFHALKPPRPSRAVYLVQREVAERLASGPGSKAYGALSVNVQAIAMAEVLFRVPPGAFQPPPKVESAVVRVAPRDDPLVAPGEEAEFQVLVQGIFGMRRKQMRRVLRGLRNVSADAADALLARCQIAPDARPETLPPDRFAALLRALRG